MTPPSQLKFKTTQRQVQEEEKKVQMKQAPFQLQEQEEEEVQMKQAPFQLQKQEEEEIQMKQAPFQLQEQEEEEIQMKQAPFQLQEQEEEEIQMKVALGSPNHVQGCGCSSCSGGGESTVQQKKKQNNGLRHEETVANASSGTQTKMPQEVQMKMETALSSNFSNVNIHVNSEKASQIGARAYTQGSDIHFAQGEYAPESSKGQELLGHELTHIVQQREGRVQPTMEVKGMPVNDSDSLENEANMMGRKASSTQMDKATPSLQQKKKQVATQV